MLWVILYFASIRTVMSPIHPAPIYSINPVHGRMPAQQSFRK